MSWIALQITAGGMNDALLFAGVDAGRCAAKSRVTSQSHFNKNERLAVQRDAVDFTPAHAVVAGKYAQPGLFQVRRSHRFCRIAGHLLWGERGILVWHPIL